MGRRESSGTEVSSTPLTHPPGGWAKSNPALLPRDSAAPESSSRQLYLRFVDIAYPHSGGRFKSLGPYPEVVEMRNSHFSFGKAISHRGAAPVGLINQINHALLNFSQASDCNCIYSVLACLWQLLFWKPLNLQVKVRGVLAQGVGSCKVPASEASADAASASPSSPPGPA